MERVIVFGLWSFSVDNPMLSVDSKIADAAATIFAKYAEIAFETLSYKQTEAFVDKLYFLFKEELSHTWFNRLANYVLSWLPVVPQPHHYVNDEKRFLAAQPSLLNIYRRATKHLSYKQKYILVEYIHQKLKNPTGRSWRGLGDLSDFLKTCNSKYAVLDTGDWELMAAGLVRAGTKPRVDNPAVQF